MVPWKSFSFAISRIQCRKKEKFWNSRSRWILWQVLYVYFKSVELGQTFLSTLYAIAVRSNQISWRACLGRVNRVQNARRMSKPLRIAFHARNLQEAKCTGRYRSFGFRVKDFRTVMKNTQIIVTLLSNLLGIVIVRICRIVADIIAHNYPDLNLNLPNCKGLIHV